MFVLGAESISADHETWPIHAVAELYALMIRMFPIINLSFVLCSGVSYVVYEKGDTLRSRVRYGYFLSALFSHLAGHSGLRGLTRYGRIFW